MVAQMNASLNRKHPSPITARFVRVERSCSATVRSWSAKVKSSASHTVWLADMLYTYGAQIPFAG
jgi:hypothetical protein